MKTIKSLNRAARKFMMENLIGVSAADVNVWVKGFVNSNYFEGCLQRTNGKWSIAATQEQVLSCSVDVDFFTVGEKYR